MFLVILLYTFANSDLEDKQTMKPLANSATLLILKIANLAPLLIFLYVLSTVVSLNAVDFFAIVFVTAGAYLVSRAKADLGQNHTRPGYHKRDTYLIKHGVYSQLRHPIYAGNYLFIFGSLLTVVNHGVWYLVLFTVLCDMYLMPYLAILAVRETEMLSDKLGKDFAKYYSSVHAFIPKFLLN